MPHLRQTQLGVLFLCFASAVSVTLGGIVGVNFGTVANNLPAAVQVAQILLTTPLRNVKLYSADQVTLQAFANTGIKVAVGVTSNEIAVLAGSVTGAQSWVQTNVAAYMPATQFNYIVVGNEVLTVSPELGAFLVPAMTNLHTALVNLQLDGQVHVSTPHNFNLIGKSFPPSMGAFDNNVSATMQSVLAFLSQTKAPFMVNAYPYFAYSANPSEVSLNYATFQQPDAGITDINTGLHYRNLLDAQLDAVFSAMECLGYNDIPIVISETGWPSVGDSKEVGCGMTNAQIYNGNLIKHITSNVGTPLRPGISTDAFVFALFNEDKQPGSRSERNLGRFNADETVVHNLGLSQNPEGSPSNSTSPPPPLANYYPPISSPVLSPPPYAEAPPPYTEVPPPPLANYYPPISSPVLSPPPYAEAPPPYTEAPPPPLANYYPPISTPALSPPPYAEARPPYTEVPPPDAEAPSAPVYFYPPPAPSVPIYPPPAATVPPTSSPPSPAPVTAPPTPVYIYPSSPPPTPSPPAVPVYPPPPAAAAVPPTPSPGTPATPTPSSPVSAASPPGPPDQAQPVGKTWCVANPGAALSDVTNALNYACGEGGANCVPIQPGNACYQPNTMTSHASYAFNSYYQLNGRNYWNCYFGNTGLVTITDPSYAGCPFP